MPILGELIAGGVEYGTQLLIEFEPESLWYETSLTIAADALKNRIKTEYHVHQHLPDDIRQRFGRLGLSVKQLEAQGLLRIIDSYTYQTGLGPGEEGPGGWQPFASRSLDLKERGRQTVRHIKRGISSKEKRWLHIDDNASVFLQYNTEQEMVDDWRITLPWLRGSERVLLTSLIADAASTAFYRKLEALCDGIVDFKTHEENGQIEHSLRVRVVRGRGYDSRWHRLKVLDNGQVKLVGERPSREFKFGSRTSTLVFDYLVDAFLADYMRRKFHAERSGWRSLVDIARGTRIPVRTLYGKKGGIGVPLEPLLQKGLAESRLFPGERGRGGEVTRLRVAYEKDPIKEYVNQRLRGLA